MKVPFKRITLAWEALPAAPTLTGVWLPGVAMLQSNIKPAGLAPKLTRMHKGGKYSFEVGPSIFEGLEAPSQNPNAHAVAATCLHNIAGVSTFPSSLQRCARNET